MQWFCAERLPLTLDLAPLVTYLRQKNVPCWVSEEGGQQVVWLQSEAHRPLLAEALTALQAGALPTEAAPAAEGSTRSWPLKHSPVTLGLLILGLAGALLVYVDSNLQWVRWLTFTDLALRGQTVYVFDLSTALSQGQWWRLLSPMVLHFGLFHILFNSLWIWELGRRIEFRRSGLVLILLSLFTSLAANLLQYFMSGPSLFGGMSGVLYGYVGYIWVWQRLWPAHGFSLPGGIIAFMLVWLVLCFSGIVDSFIDGQVANGAHLGGLIGGVVFGLFEMLKRRWFAPNMKR